VIASLIIPNEQVVKVSTRLTNTSAIDTTW